MNEILIETARKLEKGERFALVTVTRAIGSTPRKEGSRMIVEPSGKAIGSVGGAKIEQLAIERALKALISGKTERLELSLDDLEGLESGMVCGGRIELLIEPFGMGPRLLLFGAGHVAQATARMAGDVGFAVVVHDERPEWANSERYPQAEIKVGKTENLARDLVSTGDDFITVMTHSHDEDLKTVRQILRKQFYYLGVIGSNHKSIEIRRKLSEEGFTDDEIGRVTCPIGLDIGSHTPAEIAISIAAQLIETRRRWEKERD